VSPSSTLSRDCQICEQSGWRSITDEGRALIRRNVAKTACRANQCLAPFAKIFRFRRRANHLYKFAPSHPTRGAYRDRHETRGGMRWTRQRFARDGIAGRVLWIRERSTARGREMLQRTAKSCGPDAPMLASSSRSCVGPTGLRQNLSAGDGGKRARSPGRARNKS
jgi:hypothetical protein